MASDLIQEKLKGIETNSLVDRVEARLVELLQSRQLKVGDTIPKEIELAEIIECQPDRHPGSPAPPPHHGPDRIP